MFSFADGSTSSKYLFKAPHGWAQAAKVGFLVCILSPTALGDPTHRQDLTTVAPPFTKKIEQVRNAPGLEGLTLFHSDDTTGGPEHNRIVSIPLAEELSFRGVGGGAGVGAAGGGATRLAFVRRLRTRLTPTQESLVKEFALLNVNNVIEGDASPRILLMASPHATPASSAFERFSVSEFVVMMLFVVGLVEQASSPQQSFIAAADKKGRLFGPPIPIKVSKSQQRQIATSTSGVPSAKMASSSSSSFFLAQGRLSPCSPLDGCDFRAPRSQPRSGPHHEGGSFEDASSPVSSSGMTTTTTTVGNENDVDVAPFGSSFENQSMRHSSREFKLESENSVQTVPVAAVAS